MLELMILGGYFDISKLNNRLEELKLLINEPNFWEDIKKSTIINKEYNSIKKKVDYYNHIKDSLMTIELCKNEMTEEDINKEISTIEEDINNLEREMMFNGDYDNLNCYLEIHPGAGGTESCDWASMLMRMYQRFCEKYSYQCDNISISIGEEAGIKNCLLLIKGDNAYGFLKRESGVHRLVRISPFDSNKRRHTSFASVTITPEFNEIKEITINESDLKIDVFHSSGAGGQSVNTSNSAVRITHIPSKIVVSCQQERSQLKNKEIALKILKNKLYERYLEEEEKKKDSMKNTSLNIEFGSQIRNYVLEPYKLVKDLRSDYEDNDPDKILDGEIYDMLDYNLKNIKD